ncbi:hypothetical protein AFLA70_391g000830 [Aspergillus flavus AF70]|nr:hypothetical protein AFLA70_391g000830 [Aspergillus flavus AF70]
MTRCFHRLTRIRADGVVGDVHGKDRPGSRTFMFDNRSAGTRSHGKRIEYIILVRLMSGTARGCCYRRQ